MTRTKPRKKDKKKTVEMPTTSKMETAVTTTGPATTTGKRGTRKATETHVEPAITDAEAILAARYPHQCILPGSYRVAGGRDGWSNKHTVVIVCKACDRHRVLATSDLQWHTTAWCVACGKDVKKNRRKTKDEKKGQ